MAVHAHGCSSWLWEWLLYANPIKNILQNFTLNITFRFWQVLWFKISSISKMHTWLWQKMEFKYHCILCQWVTRRAIWQLGGSRSQFWWSRIKWHELLVRSSSQKLTQMLQKASKFKSINKDYNNVWQLPYSCINRKVLNLIHFEANCSVLVLLSMKAHCWISFHRGRKPLHVFYLERNIKGKHIFPIIYNA